MTFAEILQKEKESQKKKLADKIPEWADKEIEIPESINLEQCSSSATAKYKAGLVNGNIIADLTGGLGVDSWAFSKRFEQVLYNDRNSGLAKAVKSNFARLALDNIKVFNLEAEEFIKSISSCDWIFADPARRSVTGKKVFLLQDCSPDILSLKSLIFDKADNMMLKLSPMIDISLLRSELGKELSEIHVIGTDSEVKEILCILHKNKSNQTLTITATNLEDSLKFTLDEIDRVSVNYSLPEPGEYLFEPSPVLIKSGMAKCLGLDKLAQNTQLYRSREKMYFGKNHLVSEVLDFNNANLKSLARRFPHSEITARNIPVSSDGLKKKMSLESGNEAHIFAVSTISGRKLIVTDKSVE